MGSTVCCLVLGIFLLSLSVLADGEYSVLSSLRYLPIVTGNSSSRCEDSGCLD